jgi:PadR family transcriptional regulator, regulatory protein AphA
MQQNTLTPLNQTARIVLGMIAEGHTTGYAIKAEIERSARPFWSASVGGIYPELKRLSEGGLISVRNDPRGDAVRHCYELTPSGREALHRWLTEPSEPVLELRDESLLRLRFAGVLEPDEQVAIISCKRALHEQRVAKFEALLEADQFDDPFDRMTTEFSLGLNRWARDWCIETERRLARRRRPKAA